MDNTQKYSQEFVELTNETFERQGLHITPMGSNPRWNVVDNQSGDIVAGPFKSKTGAHRKADKLDLAYGAIRYSVVPVKVTR
jgi:hypothetical protein